MIYTLVTMIVCCRNRHGVLRCLTSTVTQGNPPRICRVNENELFWGVVVCRPICKVSTYLLKTPNRKFERTQSVLHVNISLFCLQTKELAIDWFPCILTWLWVPVATTDTGLCPSICANHYFLCINELPDQNVAKMLERHICNIIPCSSTWLYLHHVTWPYACLKLNIVDCCLSPPENSLTMFCCRF